MGIDQLGLNLEGLYKTIRLSAPGHDVSPTIGPKQTRAINASPSGDIMSTTSSDSNSQWDEVLSSAARLQTILPQAVLVGGTAASIYAHHRQSTDDDHVLTDLKQNFDEILDATELPKYKNLDPKWHKWESVVDTCRECAVWIQDDIIMGQHVDCSSPVIPHSDISQAQQSESASKSRKPRGYGR